MMNRAAVLAPALLMSLTALASADDAPPATTTTTTTAETLVVVTPNAPVIVQQGQVQAPAQAQPVLAPPGAAEAPPAAAPTAPQNENWNNVSHINGSIVPVGERNAYLYAYKKVNLQSNPLAWMFGYYQAAGSYALSQNVALSLEVSGWSTSNGNDSGYQIAATLPIYFKRTYSGPFLEPGLVVHTDNNQYSDCYDCYYDASGTSGSQTMSKTWVGPEIMFGWSWMFDSGLNVSAAFGAARPMGNNNTSSYNSDDPIPVGYFRVGYAF